MSEREWLECPCCGADAIQSDEEGYFSEDQVVACPDCECTVAVVVNEHRTGKYPEAGSELACDDGCRCCAQQVEPPAEVEARGRREEREEDEAVERYYEGEEA